MTKEQWEKYNDFIEDFENLPLHLNDLPAITINKIRQVLIKIISLYGPIDFVLVDYIQLQGVDEEMGTRQEEVSSVSRGLKSIAKEFGVPVLAAAQLSRAIEQRADKRPVLSDLRESGSLEQDSDIVAFLHQSDEFDKSGIYELIVAKHRNGPVGSIELLFRKTLAKFEGVKTRILKLNDKEEERALYAQQAAVGSED